MAQLVHASLTYVTLKTSREELAEVIRVLCLVSEVSEFMIAVFVEGGQDLFSVSFNHIVSPDSDPSKSDELTQLKKMGLIS